MKKTFASRKPKYLQNSLEMRVSSSSKVQIYGGTFLLCEGTTSKKTSNERMANCQVSAGKKTLSENFNKTHVDEALKNMFSNRAANVLQAS